MSVYFLSSCSRIAMLVAVLCVTAARAQKHSPVHLVAAANLDSTLPTQSVRGKEGPVVLPPNDASKGAAIVLWNDKGGPIHTGITADVPSEAELSPALSGIFEFQA